MLGEPGSSSTELKAALRVAITRSSDLVVAATRTCEESRERCLQSRTHLSFVRLVGEIDGAMVAALVRTDCTISADPLLLQRARIVVALHETFDEGNVVASLSGRPLAAALTLIRACDRVRVVELRSRA
jgi:hypothetical protein